MPMEDMGLICYPYEGQLLHKQLIKGKPEIKLTKVGTKFFKNYNLYHPVSTRKSDTWGQ